MPNQDFSHGHILFHLDNPDPDPVERETIYNPNLNIRPDWTRKSGSGTPLSRLKSVQNRFTSYTLERCNARATQFQNGSLTPLKSIKASVRKTAAVFLETKLDVTLVALYVVKRSRHR